MQYRKQCARCNESFTATHRRKIYCDCCKEIVRKEVIKKAKERYHKAHPYIKKPRTKQPPEFKPCKRCGQSDPNKFYAPAPLQRQRPYCIQCTIAIQKATSKRGSVSYREKIMLKILRDPDIRAWVLSQDLSS